MKKLFLFCSTFWVVLSSCQKDITTGNEAEQANSKAKHYPHKYKIDGKDVEKNEFFTVLLNGAVSSRSEESEMSAIADNYHVLNELARPEPTGTFDVTGAFTNTQAYYTYAQDNGYTNVETVENAYSDLADYAESSGAISQFESTGIIPADYVRYMGEYLQQHNLPFEVQDVQPRSLTNVVYKECYGLGSSWPIRSNPWLGMFGFNDNISSFYVLGFIGGRSDLFDKTFFRTRMGSIWSWANNTIDLCYHPTLSYMNNRASSWGSF